MRHDQSPTTFFVWLFSLAAALLLATAGGWMLGWHELWAFHFLTFVPLLLRLVFAALVIAAAITPSLRLRPLAAASRQQPTAIFSFWPVLIVSACVFWLFREHTLRGDALLKLKLLAEQTIRSDPYVWKEPLDSLITYTLTGCMRGLGQPPAVAVAVLSVCAGVVFVAALWYLCSVITTGRTRIIYAVGMLALGSSQLWFGHVENYSLVTAASFAATALAVGYLRGRNALWPVGLAAGVALSFHPQAAFTLPALLTLLDRPRWWRQSLTLTATGLVGPLLTVLGLLSAGVAWPNLAGGYGGDSQLFLTPAQMIAPAQIWDALNNLWLVAPLAPLWLVLGVGLIWQQTLWQDRLLRYLTVLASGLLIYHFTFQNDLPRPRDWDLFAIVGPGVTLWGLYLWQLRGEGSKRFVLPALTFAVLVTVSWLGVNYNFTLIRPRAAERAIYQRYQLLDLTTLLAQATITPLEPICGEPSGCERVALTAFTMPQDGDTRPVIFAHAPARIALPITVPNERTFLWLSPALDPQAWGWGGDGVTFQVGIEQNGNEALLWSRHLNPADQADLGWQEAFIPLDNYRGQRITLVLTTTPGPANDNSADRAGWGMPWLMRGALDEGG